MTHFEEKDDSKTLVEQKQALAGYLDALFREMPVIEAEPPKDEVLEDVPVGTRVKTPIANERPSIKPVAQVTTQASPAPSCDEIPVKYFQPATEFQVLFFKLGKLNLAIPLEHLSGILKVADEKVTPIPGYVAWHLGLMKHQGTTVNIIDTAKLIVPAHRQDMVQDQRKYRYFILLDERRWGIGCHSVAEVVKLKPSEVKWRNNRTLQPWLAGTVIDKMCALIDVEGFLRLLHQTSATRK